MKKLLFAVATTVAVSGMVWSQQNVENEQSVAPQNEQRWRTNGNQSNADHYLGTRNEAPLRLNTNGSERLRITPEGNVGIGTSEPVEKLDVNGSIRVTDYLQFEQHIDKDEDMQFLFLDGSGKSDVMGFDGLKYNILGGQYCLKAQSPFTLEGKSGCQDEPLANWAGTHLEEGCIPVLYTAIDEDGCNNARVGVGTNSPQAKFHLVGDSKLQGKTSVGANLLIGTTATSVMDNASARLTIYSHNRDFIRLQKSVTSKPEFKVNKDGKVFAREVKVTLQDIPDYVFLPDYELPSVKAQANFIKENGHLLHVPSEKEIIENNIGLGELTLANLKVSEEQMLYLIEMDEQLERLTEENNELKEKVQRLEMLMEKLLNEKK